MYAKIYGHVLDGFHVVIEDGIDWNPRACFYDYYNDIFYHAGVGELVDISPELKALMIQTAKDVAQRAQEMGLYDD